MKTVFCTYYKEHIFLCLYDIKVVFGEISVKSVFDTSCKAKGYG